MRRALLFFVALCIFASTNALAAQGTSLTGFVGRVLLPPGSATLSYQVYLYQGDANDPNFYATRALIASTQTDADGNFLLVASNLPLSPLTIRVKNSASRTGGDSVRSPGPEGWPAVISGVDITPTSQADPRFGISTNNYARQQMYFVTDRQQRNADFGNTIDVNQTPSMGTFVAHVALGPGQATLLQCGIAPDWKCDGPQVTNDDSFVDNITAKARGAEARSALAVALANPAGNSILLFVHGYNNSFDEGASTAARLSYLMEPAVHTTLLYSWPSENKAHGYIQDKNNADKSAKQNLTWVLDDLSRLPSHPKIILAAHSMGSYAITTALYDWALAHPTATDAFDSLILFAADLDVSLWRQTYQPMVGRVVKHIRFYSNANDQALRASKCATGDNTDRVGQVVSWTPPAPPPSISLTSFDATPYSSTSDYGHGYITSSTSVALNWNAVVDPTPMADLKQRMTRLPWLQDGGGSPIDWDTVQISVLCNIWNRLP